MNGLKFIKTTSENLEKKELSLNDLESFISNYSHNNFSEPLVSNRDAELIRLNLSQSYIFDPGLRIEIFNAYQRLKEVLDEKNKLIASNKKFNRSYH